MPDVAGQIAQELANHLERFFFGLCEVVDHTRFIDLRSLVAEVFLGDIDAQRSFDHRRTARKHLADPLNHQIEMCQARIDRRQPGYRP